MAGGMRKYTNQEADNTALGQGGSVYLDGTSATAPSGTAFVAITMIEATVFAALTAEGSFLNCPQTGTASSLGGDAIEVNVDEFPAGVTIYGRWTTVDTYTGAAIAYLG